MKKKYLITGGLGFIGKAITKSLIEKNNSVIIVDNQFRHKSAKNFGYNNCRIYKIDIRNKTSLKKAQSSFVATSQLTILICNFLKLNDVGIFIKK